MSKTYQVRNPRTGKHDYSFTAPSGEALTAMAAELRENQKAWAAQGLSKRIAVMQKWKEALPAITDALTEACFADTGRYILSASEVASIPGTIDRWCSDAPAILEGPSGRADHLPHIRYETNLVPYALVADITPWNFPLTLALIDVIPALLAGCAIIVKPSEVTPRFIEPLMKSVEAIPELHGVLRILQGGGETGAALIDLADAVCFTGSVATGQKVGEQAMKKFIPAFLELGGKDPMIILESTDIEKAASLALRASCVGTGHACQSIERVYVARSIYDAVLARLVEKAGEITFNAPDRHKGILGPVIFDKQVDILREQITDAVIKGATIAAGGEIVEIDGGSYCPPTVLTNITPDMKVMTDETFGPIIPVIPFETVDEAIAMANDSEFGLSAAVLAGTEEEAIHVASHLEVGSVSINDGGLTSMFHGAEKNSFKKSGIGGSRMGSSGMRRFLRSQSLLINTGDALPLTAFAEENL